MNIKTYFVDCYYMVKYTVRYFIKCLPILSHIEVPYRFMRNKNSHTLFILGSGESINNITDSEWKHINKHDILGFNNSCFLKIKNTYYFYEISSLGTEQNLLRFNEIKKRIDDKYITIVIIKNLLSNYGIKIPIKNCVAFPELYIATNNENIFKYYLRMIKLFKINRYFLINKRASVFSAAVFGIALGYKEIVFCGVDLNNTKYYYQNYLKYPSAKNVKTGQSTKGTHKTADPKFGMPIHIALKILSEVESETKFFIYNKNSMLSQYFSCYKISYGE